MHIQPNQTVLERSRLPQHRTGGREHEAPIGALFPATQPSQLTYFGADEEIYGQGEAAGALYQVEFGVVRIFCLLADGRRQISAFHVANEVFGFEADGQHHFFAEAVCASGVRVFREPIDPQLSRRILPLAVAALVRAQEHLLVIGRRSATERVAAFLADMMDRQGGLPQVELMMSRADISDYLGLTIETVSRAMTKLRKAGHIRLTGARSIEIMRPGSLRRLCD